MNIDGFGLHTDNLPFTVGEAIDVRADDVGARCATIEDVNALIALEKPLRDGWKFTVNRFIEEGGRYMVNPAYESAPFGIILIQHKDGRKWLCGVKLDKR